MNNDKLIAEARELLNAMLGDVEDLGYAKCHKPSCNTIKELIDALEAAEKRIPRWIPCEERLPEELDGEQEYRCLVSHQRFNDMRPCFTWVDTARFKNGKFWSDTPTTHTIPLLVTHWMPLPKGAEEEK